MSRKKKFKYNKKQKKYSKSHEIASKKDKERTLVVGTFEKNRNFGFVVPDGKKVLTDIYISKKNTKGAKNGEKVLVELTR